MKPESAHKLTLLFFLALITALFLAVIRPFIMALFLSGLFSAFVYPLYLRLVVLFNGRSRLASLACVTLVVVVVVLPITLLLTITAGQALKVSQSAVPWVQKFVAEPSLLSDWLSGLPWFDKLIPHKDFILQKGGAMVASLGGMFFERLSAATLGTANMAFMAIIFLYAMYFFLMEGGDLLEKILYYLPLQDEDERRMLDRFTSVTRATLKGTVVIGVIQGTAAGVALAAAGFSSAVFWGTIMTVLSVIPGVGSALVWFPAAVILGVKGHLLKAALLMVFCGGVVGSVDNLLRPRLVGQDTGMHELLIFLSTLGGIAFFGIIGFIIGPIVAALFVTVWEMYGVAFADYLPEVVKNHLSDKPALSEEPDAPRPSDPP